MSMLAQLVSRGKIASLSHSLRHTDSCGVLHERAQVRGFACATHLPADWSNFDRHMHLCMYLRICAYINIYIYFFLESSPTITMVVKTESRWFLAWVREKSYVRWIMRHYISFKIFDRLEEIRKMFYTSLGTVSFTKTVFGYQPRCITHLDQDSIYFFLVDISSKFKNPSFFPFYFIFSKLTAVLGKISSVFYFI